MLGIPVQLQCTWALMCGDRSVWDYTEKYFLNRSLMPPSYAQAHLGNITHLSSLKCSPHRKIIQLFLTSINIFGVQKHRIASCNDKTSVEHTAQPFLLSMIAFENEVLNFFVQWKFDIQFKYAVKHRSTKTCSIELPELPFPRAVPGPSHILKLQNHKHLVERGQLCGRGETGQAL